VHARRACSWKGAASVRRFAWQIGGLGVAAGACVVLGVLAFGCGSGAPARPSATASPTARPTASADPRVAEVDAAVRRYVQAREDSARTGDPTAVDALVVPGSQAAGSAGVASSFSRDNHFAFIASRIDFSRVDAQVNVDSATATVTYSTYGHLADWPSLKPREADRENGPFTLKLVLELHGTAWLVSQSS
jgi:hypothetical protein